MTHGGNIRCDHCYHVIHLPVDPVTEFAHGRSVSFVCPNCGSSETLTHFKQLTRPCFDCKETATGRFWGWYEGLPAFSCCCPNGHLHYVYRTAFNGTANTYDIKSYLNAPLDAINDRWRSEPVQQKTTLTDKSLRDVLKSSVLGSDTGLSESVLAVRFNVDRTKVQRIMEAVVSREGDIYMTRDPHTNEIIYRGVA